MMMKQNTSKTQFVVCINNEGYAASLELRKIYQVLIDDHAADHHLVRVIDESGEDYLYPEDWFKRIVLSPPEHRTHFEEHVKTAFDAGKAAEGKGKGLLGFLWGGSNSNTESSTSGAVQSVGDAAKDAWEKEKQNQQNGGPLDQLALDTGSSAPEPKKKGWW